MTFIWLFVWLIYGTPVHENKWWIALGVCVFIDLLKGGEHL